MPRHRTLSTLIGVAVFASMLSVAAPALACSCIQSNVREQISRSDVVFTGTVVAHSGPRTGPITSSMDPVTWKFRVEGVQKGDVTLSQSVVSASSSASCGYEFSPGRRYRVMASWIEGDLQTGLCDGTHATQRVAGEPPAPDSTEEPSEPAGEGAGQAVRATQRWSPTLLALGAGGVLLLGGIGAAIVLARRRSAGA